MVAIPIKFVLVIVFACCHCQCASEKIGSDSSTCAEKLQISPDTFSSVEYANFLIEIYEHIDNNKPTTTNTSQKKYFYSPLAILDHKSAVSLYNNVTNQSEMRFRIEMWNDKVQNEVVKHLKKIVGHEIKSNQVRVIPTKKIILTSDVPTAEYSISSPWTNYDKSKILRLSLSCFDQKVCDKLANEMRSNPEQFDHFKLLFRLSSQTSQTKQATINIDSVTSGSMISHLLQKFEDKNEIFLTATDEKKMLTESAANIRMEMFNDCEIASPDTENQIVNILKDLLITSRTIIKEQNDKMWDSVFWNDDNYRPDKTTKTLNEILNKLDKETQKKLANLFQKAESQSGIKLTLDEGKNGKRIQHNYDANSWTEVDKISSIISGKYIRYFDTSVRVESLKEDVEKLLQQSRNHVQWDGEEFVPKPLQLSRINLGKFRDPQSFQDRNVRVRYTNAELSAPIKLMENAELTVTDEWNNLKEQLKATAELLNTTSGELSSELSSVKLDLAAAVMKLEEMNNELIKVKRDFTIKLEAAESRGTPYVMQSPPPPPPVPVPAPQPGGVNPQAPYAAGGPTSFGAGGPAYHEPTEIREEVTTNLECQKTYVNVFFKFSKPFGGYIYPCGFFNKCILFVGHGEKEVKLTLSQDICGAPPPPLVPGYSQRTNPFIEHRLMIQWDTDLVQEYDTNILIRCDRPEDYNRTIKFDLSSVVGEQYQAIVRTHPGPKLWMEIQDGEGPTAPPVLGPVFLGQTLSLVFTLGDDVFNFDSNVLSCWATDGKTTQPLVPYVDPSRPARPLVTQLQVIDASCSVKPKLFGNFQKIRESTPTLKTTTEWVLFKAFRFPTTARVLIQCDIQVCFEKCYYPLTPCNLPYNSAVVNSTDTSNDVNPERLSMYRAIEVFHPKDEDNLPMAFVESFNKSNL